MTVLNPGVGSCAYAVVKPKKMAISNGLFASSRFYSIGGDIVLVSCLSETEMSVAGEGPSHLHH